MHENEVNIPYDFQVTVDRLIENCRLLSEIVEEVHQELGFSRIKREIYNDWAIVVSFIRKNRVFLHKPEPDIKNLIENFPSSYSELKNNLPLFIQNRDILQKTRLLLNETINHNFQLTI